MRTFDEDAAQDAWVELLERKARGEVIRNEGGFLRVVARHAVVHALRARDAERRALGQWLQGERTDLYGSEPRVVLRGEAYKDFLRTQKREAARRRRAAA